MTIKLKDIYLFKGITDDQISMIIDNSRREKINEWDTIIKQSDESDWNAYIIQSWNAIVEINWDIIKELNEWDIFWEIALITNEKRTATIKAKTNLILLKLNKDLLFEIIRKFENWKEIQKIVMDRIIKNTKKKNY